MFLPLNATSSTACGSPKSATQPTLEEIFIEKVQEKSPEQFDLDLPLPQLEVPEGSYQGA